MFAVVATGSALHLAGRPLAPAPAAALAADTVPVELATTAVEHPAAYAAIERDPDRTFGIVDLPLGYVPGNRAMLAQVFHAAPSSRRRCRDACRRRSPTGSGSTTSARCDRRSPPRG